MRRPTLTDRVRYRFDTLMSRGAPVLIACLWIASVALIVVVSAIVSAAGVAPPASSGRPLGFTEVAWMCLMRILDGGTMGQDAGPWGFLLAMLFITTCGILLMSALVGIVTAGIDQRVQEMRKGRSFVVERGHVVVLGWSEQIVLVLRELLRANEGDARFRAVVLAPRDKVEMEDELQRRLEPRAARKVVCRTGDPTDLKDLEIVNPDAARAVVLLSAPGAERDARIVQSAMALNAASRDRHPYIVTEASSTSTGPLLELVESRSLVAVASLDLVARLAAQTCRQPGLAAVYHDLLDFDGNEIYLGPARDVSGSTFGDALLAFADAIPIGMRRAGGALTLNPPMTTRIVDGDELIAIATGPADVRFTGFQRGMFDASVIASRWSHQPRERAPERTLVLGWNEWTGMFLEHLDGFVPPGSSAVVVAEELERPGAPDALVHLALTHVPGDVAQRATLEKIDLASFQHVLVVADTRLPADLADARSLVVLLLLRQMLVRTGHTSSVTSEILVEKNREVLLAAGVDDLISSAQVAGLMIAQVVQQREISRVFEALLDPCGAEFYLKAAEHYVSPGVAVDFTSAIVAAREHGEVAVGYRLGPSRGGLVLNPSKIARITFEPGDRLVVLAED